MALDGGIKDVLWPGVAQWRSVLVQQVHQFLCDLRAELKYFHSKSLNEFLKFSITCFVLSSSSFLRYESCGSVCCLRRYSATCLAGNSVSHTYPKSLARWMASPSTNDVSRVTLAAFLRPAGKLRPIFSSFSLSSRPPFLLFALCPIKKF